VGEVEHHADGPAGVLVVVLVVAVAFQYVEDVEDQSPCETVFTGHARLFLRRVAVGRMSGATPVPVAGFQPHRGR
jgi:hypothetical protein